MSSSPPENDGKRSDSNQTPRPQKTPSKGDSPPRSALSGPWLIVILILVIVLFWMWQSSPTNTGSSVEYSFFRKELEQGNVDKVRIFGDILTGQWKTIPENPDPKGGKLKPKFNTVLMPKHISDEGLYPLLREKVENVVVEKTSIGVGTQLMFWLFIPLMMFAVFWFLIRRASDPMSSGMMGGFIRSSAKRFVATEEQTTFDDVAAMEQAKSELLEVVEFLKSPAKFQRLGAQIPKGVLLMGPPGTGKTLLARATAGEADVPFFSINGSEFIQMFVGVGASRVRDLFQNAKQNQPCIIFIDEIDAVGRVRGAGLGGGHDEREQTLNQILSEMDGFQQNEAVIVLAATNRPDVLDPALLRPGRFDRHITIDFPNAAGRLGILKVHSRKVPLADDVNLKEIAAGTVGFSGADLRNLVNEAALHATREMEDAVGAENFEFAHDRVIMGSTREDLLNKHEREMTAYHESGHALLAWLLPEVDPVHKVTIIPRGRALGVTQLLPDEERYHIGEKRLHSQITMMLGGRAAEKLVFDEYSAGAEDDLKKATAIAHRMVAHWGMSEVIGPVAFRQTEEHPFLGKEIHAQRQFSEETARIIDQEVQRFLTSAAERADKLLVKHRDELSRIADALLEQESLDKQALTELLGERIKIGADGDGMG
jgi:cell division protease FtsH